MISTVHHQSFPHCHNRSTSIFQTNHPCSRGMPTCMLTVCGSSAQHFIYGLVQLHCVLVFPNAVMAQVTTAFSLEVDSQTLVYSTMQRIWNRRYGNLSPIATSVLRRTPRWSWQSLVGRGFVGLTMVRLVHLDITARQLCIVIRSPPPCCRLLR